MSRSIFLKILAGYLLIALVLPSLILPVSFKTLRDHHINTLTDKLENFGIALRLKVITALEEKQVKKYLNSK